MTTEPTAEMVKRMRDTVEAQMKMMKKNMDMINEMIKTINKAKTEESLNSKILHNEVLYDLFEDIRKSHSVGAVMTEVELERLHDLKHSQSS